MLDRYLRNILTARIYDLAEETPLDHAQVLSRRLGNGVWLKREDCQPIFSFMIRGAYYGRVPAGFQVPHGEQAEFRQFLKRLNYRYSNESGNPAYRLFLA